jgi:hypothetical protein
MRPADVSTEDFNDMLSDPVFKNLIMIKRQRLGIVQRRSGQLAELIDEVIGLIDRDITDLGQ